MRAYRFALRPGWLVLHVLSVAAMITMVLLGRWQLTVSEHKGFSLLNFGYAIQWWLFTGFVAAMWVRVMRDQRRRESPRASDALTAAPAVAADAPVAYRRYVPPPAAAMRPEDPVYSAYNDYLARLNSENT